MGLLPLIIIYKEIHIRITFVSSNTFGIQNIYSINLNLHRINTLKNKDIKAFSRIINIY